MFVALGAASNEALPSDSHLSLSIGLNMLVFLLPRAFSETVANTKEKYCFNVVTITKFIFGSWQGILVVF
jgi:hypothetical protein